jgi:hypothetical protein
MLEGEVVYRHGESFTDAARRQPVLRRRCAARPGELVKVLPARYLSIISYPHRRSGKSYCLKKNLFFPS